MHVATESGPDGPLEPLRVGPGEAASWWGHRLRSGFLQTNTTPRSAVGLSFHAIPWAVYRESRAEGKSSHHSLKLGGYYAVAEAAPGA